MFNYLLRVFIPKLVPNDLLDFILATLLTTILVNIIGKQQLILPIPIFYRCGSSKTQGTSILKSLLALDLHGIKFEWISGIFDPILHVFAKIKVQGVTSMY